MAILVMMLLIGLFAGVWGFLMCFFPARWDVAAGSMAQQVFQGNRQIWQQADCTINGPLKDEATGLVDTAATATATGVITAKSAGTSLTKGAMKELSGAFTELFGIIEYGKVMLKMGYNMVAGCE